jgi:putative peptidoglycan lipid II flippase
MRLAILLAGLSVCNLLLQFVQMVLTITQLGPGTETDALYAGMVVPQFMLVVIGGSLSQVLVPLLAAEKPGDRDHDAWGFLSITTVFLFLGAALLALLAPFWVPVLFPGFSHQTRELTIKLTRIQLVGMVLNTSVSVTWSVCQAKRRFFYAEGSLVIAAVVATVFLFFALPRSGVQAAAWVPAITAAVQTLILFPVMGRPRSPRWNSPAINEAGRRLKPLLLGTTYYKTDPLIDRLLASMGTPGGLSLFHISQQMYGAGNQVLNKAIAVPMVPQLAELAVLRSWRSFAAVYRARLGAVTALAMAGYLIVLLLGERILRVLIGHGGVTFDNVKTLWWILVMLGGFLVGGAMGQVLSSAFYARGDTATPTRIGMIGFTIGIVLKVLGFLQAGIQGLAFGATLYLLLNAGLMFRSMELRLRDANLHEPTGSRAASPAEPQ